MFFACALVAFLLVVIVVLAREALAAQRELRITRDLFDAAMNDQLARMVRTRMKPGTLGRIEPPMEEGASQQAPGSCAHSRMYERRAMWYGNDCYGRTCVDCGEFIPAWMSEPRPKV